MIGMMWMTQRVIVKEVAISPMMEASEFHYFLVQLCTIMRISIENDFMMPCSKGCLLTASITLVWIGAQPTSEMSIQAMTFIV